MKKVIAVILIELATTVVYATDYDCSGLAPEVTKLRTSMISEENHDYAKRIRSVRNPALHKSLRDALAATAKRTHVLVLETVDAMLCRVRNPNNNVPPLKEMTVTGGRDCSQFSAEQRKILAASIAHKVNTAQSTIKRSLEAFEQFFSVHKQANLKRLSHEIYNVDIERYSLSQCAK